MKSCLLLILLFLSCSAFSQTTPYQPSEVDSIAEPRGGAELFNTFLQSTLRKPIQAEAEGTGGTVVVSGIVETDGRIADVRVVQNFRPDCDREAIRTFSLFNAWKPARKNGQSVRQQVTASVTFQANIPFTHVPGNRIDYYGADNNFLADSSQAQYKRISPIDTNGMPVNDVALYKLKAKKWKEYIRQPVVRYKWDDRDDSNNKVLYYTYIPGFSKKFSGKTFIINVDRQLFGQVTYQSGQAGPQVIYHRNGSIYERSEYLDTDNQLKITTWYDNGQVKQIKLKNEYKHFEENSPERVVTLWDSTGHQLIEEGNGDAIYKNKEFSRSDTAQLTVSVEQGRFENGFKQGIWTGHYADGSYFYEETYNKGICQSGKAYSSRADTIRYGTVEQQAEFSGGVQGIREFMSKNLHYPKSARKLNAQGQVIISFVVCTDGTLCDYEVLKSVQTDLDKEAVRAVQQMSGQWKPGIRRGQKVRVNYKLPVNFSLY